MPEKITYGIRNGHYAPVTTEADGTPIFGVVEPWVGWSELSLPPVGDPLNVYADDVVYFKMHVNQGYDGSVSAYAVPEDFKINHLGEYKDANGVMIERSSAQPKDFALLGEFQTADELASDPKRFALFNCTAGRADLSGTTKEDSLEPTSFSIPITVAPTNKDEIVKATILKSANEELFNTWFDSVYYNPDFVVTRRVSVTVTDGTTPIPGAIVTIGTKIARTNSSGIASFVMPSGTYDVLISADGFTPKVTTATVISSSVPVSVVLDER